MLLSVRDLSVAFAGEGGMLRAVDGVSFNVAAGETIGLVGESGCGKSTVALALMRLLPLSGAAITGGSVFLDGQSLLTLPEAAMRRVRGGAVGMIFQDATTSLHPLIPIGRQVSEVLRRHLGLSKAQAREQALNLLNEVGIPAADRRMSAYPHELSGGMCQRVMIAIAIACRPRLLIADEPTTALDVTVQAQILELIGRISDESGTAVILITHDLGVVAGMTDRVAVMYAGSIVELASTATLFADAAHPYTRGLLRSVPRLDQGLDEDLPVIAGSVETDADTPGCRFAPRCPSAMAICRTTRPALEAIALDHQVACWAAAHAA
jgi:oligopeptide/dipeptide ABC transporter ATP-binding protein